MQRILAIVAMDAEERAVRGKLGKAVPFSIDSRLRVQGECIRKGAKELILVKSDIGMVNAALATAWVVEKFDVDAVILFGVAGALRVGLDIGDLVIASQIVQHDSVFSGPDGVKLMAPGRPYVSVAPERREMPQFAMDQGLGDWAQEGLACQNKIRYSVGTILSGSEFVGTASRKESLANTFPGALAVEMEAAGIALVVKRLGIPMAVMKTMADRLNPDHSVSTDYNQFLSAAAENSSEVLRQLWERWAG